MKRWKRIQVFALRTILRIVYRFSRWCNANSPARREQMERLIEEYRRKGVTF